MVLITRDFEWLKAHHTETERMLNTILVSRSYRLTSYLQTKYLSLRKIAGRIKRFPKDFAWRMYRNHPVLLDKPYRFYIFLRKIIERGDRSVDIIQSARMIHSTDDLIPRNSVDFNFIRDADLIKDRINRE
jgi:hypothetical protein